MLLAEQDHLWHHEIQIGGPEGSGKALCQTVRVAADAKQVDVRASIDLPARQKKRVKTSLSRDIEQFATAIGEAVMAAASEHQNARAPFGARQQSGRSGQRRRRTDSDRPASLKAAKDSRQHGLAPPRRLRVAAHASTSVRPRNISSHAANPSALRAAAA